MSIRRRFSGDFKAKVALEALRGDKTIEGFILPQVVEGEAKQPLLCPEVHDRMCYVQADKAGVYVLTSNKRSKVRCVVCDQHISILHCAADDYPVLSRPQTEPRDVH